MSHSPTQPLEGYLHTADSQFNWLMLWLPSPTTTSTVVPRPTTPLPPSSGSIKLIPITSIQSFQLLSLPPPPPSTSNPDHIPTTINTSAGLARLEKNIALAQQSLARIGPKGTSPLDQALFEALARTMPARWDGNKMVINDTYIVEKPYGKENVRLLDEKVGRGGLERVANIVAMEKVKAELKNPGMVGVGQVNGIGGGGRGGVKKGG
jgi:hypothetical protein